MKQITKNVYYQNGFRGCNTGMVVTDAGVVLIDTPMVPTEARKWRNEVSQYGSIRYLIDTEPHLDQFAGNCYFEGTIIGHEGARNAMLAASFDEMNNMLKRLAPECLPLEKEFRYRPPDITLSEKLTLHLGKHTFQLITMPGHSPYQLAVYIPEEKVVFTSDNVTSGMTYMFQALPNEWLESLNRLEELDVEVVIPGHGVAGDKSCITEMRGHVQAWIEAVKAAIAQRLSLEEAKNQIYLLDRYRGLSVDQRLRQVQMTNIERLYNVLKG